MEKSRRDNAMKGSAQKCCARSATFAGCLLVASGLLLLAGCATADKARVAAAQPAPVVAAEAAPPLPAGPSVVHFTAGREGFLISEPSLLAAQPPVDFDQAVALIREAKYDKAVELLEKVIAKAPELTAPRINAAIAYRQLSRPEEAEPHLKKALELIPGHPLASNEYGLLLRKAGRFAESRLIYEKALAFFPEYPPLHKNLGILCDLYLKDSACAVEQYTTYDRAMPRDQQVKLWLADLQNRSGRNLTAAAAVNGLSTSIQ